jgi:dihydrofolate reductase
MRQIFGSVFQSLDGVIQGPGGLEEDLRGGFRLGGWVAPHWDDALGGVLDGFFAAPYELLLGRRTYEIFAAYWPHQPPENDFAQAFNRTAKHVLTHQDTPLGWQNSHRLADLDAVRALKRTDGPVLLVQGSGSLYPQLLAAGLIDRITLLTFPILLGTGRRVFGAGTPPVRFRQIDGKTSSAGVGIAVYEPAGPVPTANIGEDRPSPEERQRRAAWAKLD